MTSPRLALTITRDQLLALKPCDESEPLWQHLFGDAGDEPITIDWTLDELVKMAIADGHSDAAGVCVLAWLDQHGLAPSLAGAELGEYDLGGAAFTNCDLANATIKRARGAIFVNAQLRGADLRLADLRGAALTASICDFANACHADLSRATLVDASMYRALLTKTNLTNASLINCRAQRAYAWGADFSHADLTNACFKNASIRGAKFDGATLDGADFDGASASAPLPGWRLDERNLLRRA